MTQPVHQGPRPADGLGPGFLAGGPRAAADWIEDFHWHRESCRESKFQWGGTDALLIAVEFSRGQDTFTSVRDLATLCAHKVALAEYIETCERALGRAIRTAHRGLGGSLAEIAGLLRMTVQDCEHAIYRYTLGSLWADPAGPPPDSNPQVARIRRMCSGLFFGSPLILAWELKQLVGMYQAADELLEDTIVDLVLELDGVDRAALAHAASMPNWRTLEQRILVQRETRGAPGDPRRVPSQAF